MSDSGAANNSVPSTQPTSERPPPPPSAARRPRWWRRFKWTLRVLVVLPLLLLVAALVLSRSSMIGQMVTDQVRQLTGGEWTAARAVITLNGQLLVTDLKLRAPGIDGPAGQLLAADEAIADLDWWQLPPLKWIGGSSVGGVGTGGAGGGGGTARPLVTVIRLTRPVFRISQSIDDESINLTALKPPASSGGAADLPRVDVINGRIEFAEHSLARESYDPLNAIPINGALLPAGNGRPAFNIRLQEIGRAAAPSSPESPPGSTRESGERSSLILDGNIDLAAEKGSLKLYYVSLDAWPAESVPSRYRALWRQLGLQGQVTEAKFDYSPETKLTLGVKLSNVAIVVPVPASREGDEDSYLALNGVAGDIGLSSAGLTADLTGLMKDQAEPTHVELATRGLDSSSGFRCQITGRRINVPSDAGLQSYVPAIARQYLDWFGGPSAEVDTRVVIERGDPINGVPAPITVPDGQLNFRNGRAAFHKFPYWFHDMGGEVRFDDQTIRIIQITGTGSSGSPLRASGTIAPISENAQVDLRIDVDHVPVDADLLAAMRPAHRRLMEVLFSEHRYRELLGKGLIRPPSPSAATPVSNVPEFTLGGFADVRVRVQRPPGETVEWTTGVDVTFAEAGLVPEPFPFPIVGSDLKLQITDNDAVFKSGRFAGLRGGAAQVEARVHFSSAADEPPEPEVSIVAENIPIDPLLLNALPGEDALAADDASRIDARAVLGRLDIRGSVDCRVALSAPKDESASSPSSSDFVGPQGDLPVDYTVVVDLERVTAAPVRQPAAEGGDQPSGSLCIRELSGSVIVTSKDVRIPDLRAYLGRLPPTAPGSSPTTDLFSNAEPAGDLVIRVEVETMPPGVPEQGRLHAEVDLRRLDLADPVEDIIAVFSRPSAAVVRGVRQDRAPTGWLDATVGIDAPRGPVTREVEIGVEFRSAEQLAARAFGGEVAIEEPAGRVTITRGGVQEGGAAPRDRIRFDSLQAGVGFNGSPGGSFKLHGGFDFGVEQSSLSGPADLVCELSDWRFEGGLTESIIQRFAGARAVEAYQEALPRGRFNATVSATTEKHEPPRLTGWIAPTSLAFTRRGQLIDCREVEGRLTFEADSGAVALGRSVVPADPRASAIVRGRVEGARLVTDAWSFAGSGDWQLLPAAPDDALGSRLTIDSAFSASVTTMDEALRTLIPRDVSAALTSAEVRFTRPLAIEASDLYASIPIDDPDQAEVRFAGHVDFVGLSAEAGVPIRDAEGRVSISAQSVLANAAASDQPRVEMLVEAPALRLAGLALTGLRARAIQPAPGEFRVTDAAASCHGGRVFADLSASWPTGSVSNQPTESQRVSFRLGALMAGVNFAPLLDDLAASNSTVEQADAASAAVVTPTPGSDDTTRGTVDARLSLQGVAGDPASRRGRGAIRIAHGDVLRLPVVLPLMQMSNLLIPSRDKLNYLQSTFYLDGPRAVFDDIRVDSKSVSIVGSGVLTTPELSLDMRFNTRSNQRIPLWSDFFEALRNEIVSTTVTGTVDKPVIRSETLSTTRRIIGDIVQPGDSAASDTVPAWPFPAAPAAGEPTNEFPRTRTRMPPADDRVLEPSGG